MHRVQLFLIKIGVLHEYSTIEGVQEDVRYVLNLKDLSVRLTEVEDAE